MDAFAGEGNYDIPTLILTGCRSAPELLSPLVAGGGIEPPSIGL